MSTRRCRALVLKVASRCNLNCDYCYVYNLGDDTWRSQPHRMSGETIFKTCTRVREHCIEHQIRQFVFIFHGGEPLLAGQEFFREFITVARRALEGICFPIFTVQTNGTLLTEEWCRVLADLNVSVGVSIDGPQRVHDVHRVDHAGRGSYWRAVQGLQTAIAFKEELGHPGVLTVIDINNEPLEIYEHLISLDASDVDFLLPDASRVVLPPGMTDPEAQDTLYADWLIQIFDRWFDENPKRIRIRIFQSIIELILGLPARYDVMGGDANEVLVIEADGSIEPIGSLKVCGNGFTKLGASVYTASLSEAFESDLAAKYHDSGKQLPQRCQQCKISEVCGGGYLPYRFHPANGFDNPPVYCWDLLKLITHIQAAVLERLGDEYTKVLGLGPLSYEEARTELQGF
jgi:uncharacterized protein